MKIGVEFDQNGNFIGDFLDGMELPEGHQLFHGDIPEGKYGYKPKLVSGDIVEALTQTEIDAIRNAPKPPDPDVELSKAILAATTLDELKKALTGSNGKLAKVKGELK